jgi:hypothetical protein
LAPGTLTEKFCDANFKYFELINECIPIAIANTNAFLDAVQAKKTCDGGLIDSIAALEQLRFCVVIRSGLTITIRNVSADFSSLFDITEIQGSHLFFGCFVQTHARRLARCGQYNHDHHEPLCAFDVIDFEDHSDCSRPRVFRRYLQYVSA